MYGSLRRLPCASKQISNRLPVLHRESEGDSVLARKEEHAPFLTVQDRGVRVEVVALPLAKIPLQIKLPQQPSLVTVHSSGFTIT